MYEIREELPSAIIFLRIQFDIFSRKDRVTQISRYWIRLWAYADILVSFVSCVLFQCKLSRETNLWNPDSLWGLRRAHVSYVSVSVFAFLNNRRVYKITNVNTKRKSEWKMICLSCNYRLWELTYSSKFPRQTLEHKSESINSLLEIFGNLQNFYVTNLS